MHRIEIFKPLVPGEFDAIFVYNAFGSIRKNTSRNVIEDESADIPTGRDVADLQFMSSELVEGWFAIIHDEQYEIVGKRKKAGLGIGGIIYLEPLKQRLNFVDRLYLEYSDDISLRYDENVRIDYE